MKKFCSAFAALLCAALLCANITAEAAFSNRDIDLSVDRGEAFGDYVQQYSGAAKPKQEIRIEAAKNFKSDYEPQIMENYENSEGSSLLTLDTGYTQWDFTVPEDGLYHMKAEYYPVAGSGAGITRGIYIDGRLPFNEARSVNFSRVWQDQKADGEAIPRDAQDNDIKPSQVENPSWQTAVVRDSVGYYDSPLGFYLTKGGHTLRFTSLREPMLLKSILFFQYEERPYSEVEREYDDKGYKSPNVPLKLYEAELSAEKSDPMLAPVGDRSSAGISPSDASRIRLNCIGGNAWNRSGQWISWDFEVEKSGLYEITLKVKQDTVSGAFSSRRIYIDGEVPFRELSSVMFPYSTEWRNITLGDSQNGSYRFYFEAGKTHTLKIEATLGGMGEIIRTVTGATEKLNAVNRQILVVTGPTPDKDRDYMFEKTMPEVLDELRLQGRELDAAIEKIERRAAKTGENVQILKKMARQIDAILADPESIADRFSQFQNNITALATWLTTALSQPLKMDYFIVAPPSAKLPEPEAGFFRNAAFHIKSFLASFVTDYNLIADGKTGETVTVWVGNGMTGGRDQAQILKNMSDNYFTPDSGIDVNLQLISMGALLPATFSGRGPDVALTVGQSEPVNYAVRNAVADLTQFKDYPEIEKRFSASAMLSLSFGGGVFGLPETETFPMMFYRKDILSELGVKLPETWDDVLSLLHTLQQKQMNFGLPSIAATAPEASMTLYTMLLYQNGGALYTDGGRASLLDSKESIDSLVFIGSLYNDYRIPAEISFLNRFRSGSTPIGIADYMLYNQLSVFAPELEGLWGFAPVPGTVGQDKAVNHSVANSVAACIILKKSQKQKQAWEYIKWWTGAKIQAQFGRELESVLGTAARYPTANLEALSQIPWDSESQSRIQEQWKWARGIPEVPGSYYTPRYVGFAFRDTVNLQKDPGELLIKHAASVNREIKEKRREFGLTD